MVRSTMPYLKLAFVVLASLGLAACQGSVSSSGESGGGGSGGTGQGGSGGSTDTTTTSTSSTTTAVVCTTPPDVGAFEIGTGETCFEALAAEGEVTLMSGPQGGFHVWLATGCTDCGTVVHLKYGVHAIGSTTPLDGTYDEEAMAELTGKDWPQKAGLVVHMPGQNWDPVTYPPPAKGDKVLLWADAYAPNGDLWHHDEVIVTIGDTMEWNPCATNPNDPACQTG
jgi:hypothetical protein